MQGPTNEALNLQHTRILTAAICFSSPFACAIVYLFVILHGDPMGFAVGFAGLPWDSPQMLACVIPAFFTTGMGIAVHQGLLSSALHASKPAAAFRLRHIVASAFFEATAVLGLVVGFIVGPASASLALIFFLVPAVGGAFILPHEHAIAD